MSDYRIHDATGEWEVVIGLEQGVLNAALALEERAGFTRKAGGVVVMAMPPEAPATVRPEPVEGPSLLRLEKEQERASTSSARTVPVQPTVLL